VAKLAEVGVRRVSVGGGFAFAALGALVEAATSCLRTAPTPSGTGLVSAPRPPAPPSQPDRVLELRTVDEMSAEIGGYGALRLTRWWRVGPPHTGSLRFGAGEARRSCPRSDRAQRRGAERAGDEADITAITTKTNGTGKRRRLRGRRRAFQQASAVAASQNAATQRSSRVLGSAPGAQVSAMKRMPKPRSRTLTTCQVKRTMPSVIAGGPNGVLGRLPLVRLGRTQRRPIVVWPNARAKQPSPAIANSRFIHLANHLDRSAVRVMIGVSCTIARAIAHPSAPDPGQRQR
jgi:hypothetical protein